jgi:hypothetical protein
VRRIRCRCPSAGAARALLASIATTNVYNRLNVPTRQVAGAWLLVFRGDPIELE